MEAQAVDLRDAQTLYENADLASILSKTGRDEAFSDEVSPVGSRMMTLRPITIQPKIEYVL
jgi:hypothetical protein